jgi:hypothetical protein
MKKFLFLTVLVLLLSACKREVETIQFNFGYNYYPLKVGKWITYSLDSTTYDIVSSSEPFTYAVQTQQGISYVAAKTKTLQVKESVVDTVYDNLGRKGYKIHRYERKDNTDDWLLKDVWAAYSDNTFAERIEDNLRLVKMNFPVDSAKTWKSTIYIDENASFTINGEPIRIYSLWGDAKYVSVDKPYSLSGMNFDSTLVISYANDQNALTLRRVEERYARNVGMIEKTMWILDTQCNACNNDLNWIQRAQVGFKAKWRITGHN